MAVERTRRGQISKKGTKVDKDTTPKTKSLKTTARGLKNDLAISAPPKRRGRPPKLQKAHEEAKKIIAEIKETGTGEETVASKETVGRLGGAVHGLGHNPELASVGMNLPEGTNRKIIMLGIKILALPDIDINDPGQVSERLQEFLRIYAEADMKPTVLGMANSLGIDRRRLWEIATKQEKTVRINPESAAIIEKSYNLLNQYWEEYMQTGKINPVSGIFLAKNHFGYRDQTDFVVTAHTDETTFDSQSVMEKYGIDS